MNTQVLHHLAHGDLVAKPDIAEFRAHRVLFKDGSEAPVDLVLFATGYDYKLPFLDEDIFEWRDGRPQLYLNLIHRKLPGLYVLGFAEFADGAYRRFEEMAQMIVADIHARESGVRRELLDKLRESHFPDLRGGKAYIESPRHAAYVDKDTYRDVLMSLLRDLGWPAPTDRSFEAMKVDDVATTEAVARPPTPSRPHKEIGGGADGDRDRPMERQPQA
jgi:hypothetical protein